MTDIGYEAAHIHPTIWASLRPILQAAQLTELDLQVSWSTKVCSAPVLDAIHKLADADRIGEHEIIAVAAALERAIDRHAQGQRFRDAKTALRMLQRDMASCLKEEE